MVMLESPPHFWEFFSAGIVCCFIFGKYCSNHNLWTKWFPTTGKDAFEVYAKRGEYGEYELAKKGITELKNSPFMEPLNAWTSLSYTVFGFCILGTSLFDYYTLNYAADTINGNTVPVPPNRCAMFPEFGILYGASSIWLGIASFMFHASHAEPWRKSDAGMTSGVVVAITVFGLWDRLRPPGMTAIVLVLLGLILQFSLTHGYLPYGSSDTLLPTLIGVSFLCELFPRYGGPVDQQQWFSWAGCLYATLTGMLLRLSDIKRDNLPLFTRVTRILMAITIFPFGYFCGYTSPVIIFGVLGLSWVLKEPSRGHIWWHLGSSYALFAWWYMLRTRPGDPLSFSFQPDALWWSVILFGVIKNAMRRIFINLPFPSERHRDRTFFTIEHTIWTIWGYYCIQYLPESIVEGSGWLYNHAMIWKSPSFPSDAFQLFYLAKTGGALEDLIYRWVAISNHKKSIIAIRAAAAVNAAKLDKALDEDKDNDNDSQAHISYGANDASGKALLLPKQKTPTPTIEAHESDLKMDMHHIVTACLCTGSMYLGLTRIGSIIMFVHDLTDIPLDLVRLFGALDRLNAQAIAMFFTLGTWGYWRLWYLPAYVMTSIAWDSKIDTFGHECKYPSFPFNLDCTNSDGEYEWWNHCWAVLIGILIILHYIWYFMMVKKTYIELWVKRKSRR
jgi:hypothetical protein